MKFLTLAALITAMPMQALAFNFGRVRAPDWMDPYALTLLICTCVGFMLIALTKPRHVPMNALYRHVREFGFFGRLSYVFTTISFFLLMGLVFVGMGLQRAAEAGY